MRKYLVMSFLFVLLFLTACSEKESVDVQRLPVNNTDSIQIEFGSINVKVVSADIEESEASLILYDNAGLKMDKKKGKISIGVNKDITRFFKKKPELEVRIPIQFKGAIILDGSSGNVVGKDLQTHDLQVNASSGNVMLDFLQFHSHVYVKTTSGHVDVSLKDVEPDVTLLLKSNSGRRSVAIDLDDLQQNKKETRGKFSNGEYEVKLKTSSGNISLK
ncbi:DUF4097 family beta strand repeat-containing protein [Heyndrickxia sp. NPDC080065]|uniref:DUF4097 family beta strand repeat-containing protein n=1 Tax=Heyndrickxia sp. NPDC080065 TaxID=3390568 RepID=UPI003D001CC7